MHVPGYQLNATQQKIITLHEKSKGLKKRPHTIEEEKELNEKLLNLRKQLISELYPRG